MQYFVQGVRKTHFVLNVKGSRNAATAVDRAVFAPERRHMRVPALPVCSGWCKRHEVRERHARKRLENDMLRGKGI